VSVGAWESGEWGQKKARAPRVLEGGHGERLRRRKQPQPGKQVTTVTVWGQPPAPGGEHGGTELPDGNELQLHRAQVYAHREY
jgi:hypothetical protein